MTERRCVLQYDDNTGSRWRRVVGWATREQAEQALREAQAGQRALGRYDVTVAIAWGKSRPRPVDQGLPGTEEL